MYIYKTYKTPKIIIYNGKWFCKFFIIKELSFFKVIVLQVSNTAKLCHMT